MTESMEWLIEPLGTSVDIYDVILFRAKADLLGIFSNVRTMLAVDAQSIRGSLPVHIGIKFCVLDATATCEV